MVQIGGGLIIEVGLMSRKLIGIRLISSDTCTTSTRDPVEALEQQWHGHGEQIVADNLGGVHVWAVRRVMRAVYLTHGSFDSDDNYSVYMAMNRRLS